MSTNGDSAPLGSGQSLHGVQRRSNPYHLHSAVFSVIDQGACVTALNVIMVRFTTPRHFPSVKFDIAQPMKSTDSSRTFVTSSPHLHGAHHVEFTKPQAYPLKQGLDST